MQLSYAHRAYLNGPAQHVRAVSLRLEAALKRSSDLPMIRLLRLHGLAEQNGRRTRLGRGARGNSKRRRSLLRRASAELVDCVLSRRIPGCHARQRFALWTVPLVHRIHPLRRVRRTLIRQLRRSRRRRRWRQAHQCQLRHHGPLSWDCFFRHQARSSISCGLPGRAFLRHRRASKQRRARAES